MYVATERFYEPTNDQGAGVLVYAEGAVVEDEDAEKYADQVKEVSGDELKAELTSSLRRPTTSSTP